MAFSVDNKKIAKNTIALYVRQILVILISLYTSRVVLQTLGADDYGIYNVVGGLVAMCNVISGAFTVAISRFMAYVLGEEDPSKLERLFSTSLVIQGCMGILIIAILSTVGAWYVINVMVLPEGRTWAALWVLLFSSVSFFISLMAVPYNALIVAHEHMKAFAYIAVFEALAKLAIAFAITVVPFDKLIVYSFLTVATSVSVCGCYALYCRRHFEGCKFRLRIHRDLLKEMLSFVGWAFLGNGAVVLRDQGLNMIINLFGGTAINAAKGVAQQISNAVQGFANNFVQATQPEITKLRATGQLAEMRRLVCRSCRISYFLMLIMCVPLIKNIDYILVLWLGVPPEGTSIFVILILIDAMIVAINNPLLYGVLAAGDIKVYEICLSALCVACLPVSYCLMSLGISPTYAYGVIVVARFIILFLLVWQSGVYDMKWGEFFLSVGVRVLLVTAVSVAGALVVNFSFIPIEFLRFIAETLVIVGICCVVVLFLGFTKNERGKLFVFAKNKVKALVKHG